MQHFMMMLIARFIRLGKTPTRCIAPRITAELDERYQISVNRKTVAKRMRLMDIEGISPRAFVPVTTIQAKCRFGVVGRGNPHSWSGVSG